MWVVDCVRFERCWSTWKPEVLHQDPFSWTTCSVRYANHGLWADENRSAFDRPPTTPERRPQLHDRCPNHRGTGLDDLTLRRWHCAAFLCYVHTPKEQLATLFSVLDRKWQIDVSPALSTDGHYRRDFHLISCMYFIFVIHPTYIIILLTYGDVARGQSSLPNRSDTPLIGLVSGRILHRDYTMCTPSI